VSESGAPAPGKGGIIIFDCGTGFRLLGKALEEEFHGQPMRAHVFLSHFHWDHIQGLRFFSPLYQPGNRIHFYSFHTFQPHGRETLRQLLRNPIYPVESKILSSVVRFQDVHGQKVVVDGAVVTVRRLNHPHGSLAFRLDCGQKVIVYASDHEPDGKHLDAGLWELAEGADLFIGDAQYTPDEYASYRRGWGHSTWQHAVDLARRAHVKKLALFHHDPDHDDDAIDEIVEQAGKHFGDVLAAAEMTVVDLTGTRPGEAREHGDNGTRKCVAEAAVETLEGPADQDLGRTEAVLREEQVIPEDIPMETIPLSTLELPDLLIPSHGLAALPNMSEAVRNLDWGTLAPEEAVPDRRRCERVRMNGVAARAVVFRGEQRILARVLDMSFGGLALDFEEHLILPGEFRAELHVPVWPVGAVRLCPIYANLNERGMRVGCRFATSDARQTVAGLASSRAIEPVAEAAQGARV
jgi:phosphoribosyl 1,2-cyclic phosphodiesterase